MGPHVSGWFQEGVYFQRVRMSVRDGTVAKMHIVRIIRGAEPLQASPYRAVSHWNTELARVSCDDFMATSTTNC